MANTLKSKKFKVGDYVRIHNPQPQYPGLIRFKNKIGKVVFIVCDGNKGLYDISFGEGVNEKGLFFRKEIKKLSKLEYFMEIL
jgi:hypothetical protein